MSTQLEIARSGQISDAVKSVAAIENLEPAFVRDEVASGRVVICANKVHLADNLVPTGIGRALTCKVNANIGASDVRSSLDGEIKKMKMAIDLGADAMMDLSTGGDLDEIRTRLLSHCTVPLGTVPIYEVITDRSVEDIDRDSILKVV